VGHGLRKSTRLLTSQFLSGRQTGRFIKEIPLPTKTYDRNVLSGQALIANDDRTVIQYTNIRRASPQITDISFAELKQLHAIAAGLVNGQVGGARAEFTAVQWQRYAESLEIELPVRQVS
jgi:hypothetical protein